MRRLLHWVIPVGVMLCALSAQAGSLSVMPVVVALSGHKVREAITVTNQGTTHVDVVSWTQSDGKDIFAPTTDVLLSVLCEPTVASAPGHCRANSMMA